MRQTGNDAFNLSFYTEINCQTDQNRANFPSEPKPHSITDVIP